VDMAEAEGAVPLEIYVLDVTGDMPTKTDCMVEYQASVEVLFLKLCFFSYFT
jgi:hypothetical protein